MVGVPLPFDDPFFAQWQRRTSERSLVSARALLDRLQPAPRRTLTVVGSKGKGTTVAAASAALAFSGLRVVTVSSPALVMNTERLRLNGVPIQISEYRALADELHSHHAHLPADEYLSPSGAYTVMGAWWAEQVGADVLVLEEGMGGASDEISLFEAHHLAITPIFDEHIGQIAATRTELIDDLLAVVPTHAYGLGRQTDPYVEQVTSSWTARRLDWSPGEHANRLVADNIGLGWSVGADMARELGGEPGGSCPELTLPGRMSLHEVDGHTWVIDAAISPDGIAAVRRAYPDLPMIGCWPTSKDWRACVETAGDVTLVRAGTYLSFPDGLPTLDEIDLDRDYLFVGTQSFVGEVLTKAGVTPTPWWAS